jgi:hypothetical protein
MGKAMRRATRQQAREQSKTSGGLEALQNSDIAGMFNKMTGRGDIDPKIALPKYEEMLDNLHAINRVLSSLARVEDKENNIQASLLRNRLPESIRSLDEILKFNKTIVETIEQCRKKEKEPFDGESDFKDKFMKEKGNKNKAATADDILAARKGLIYKELKYSSIADSIIMLCKQLHKFRKDIGNKEKLSGSFVIKTPGPELKIFPFSSFDLKNVWGHAHMDDNIKNYILRSIHIIYKNSHNIYKIRTSPDVDVKQFSGIIKSAIEQIRNHPEVRGCGGAFNKILSSMDMFEGNFGTYYKQYEQSQNQFIIMENFVLDVSNSTSADSKVTRQFKKIIRFFQKQTQGKVQDPRMQQLMNAINKSFTGLEKEMGSDADDVVLSDDEDSDSDSDDDDEKSTSTTTTTTTDGPPKKTKTQTRNAKRRAATKRRAAETNNSDMPPIVSLGEKAKQIAKNQEMDVVGEDSDDSL